MITTQQVLRSIIKGLQGDSIKHRKRKIRNKELMEIDQKKERKEEQVREEEGQRLVGRGERRQRRGGRERRERREREEREQREEREREEKGQRERREEGEKNGRAPSELQSQAYLVCRLLLEKKKH